MISQDSQICFFEADILTCHNRKSTGVNNVNNGFVVFWRPDSDCEPACTIQVPRNGIQPSFILLFTLVFFLLWHVSKCLHEHDIEVVLLLILGL